MSGILKLLVLLAAIMAAAIAPAAAGDAPPVWWDDALEMAEEGGYRLIDREALENLLAKDTDAIIIDARPDYEFDQGHIPGAVNLEFDLSDETRLADARRRSIREVMGTDKERTVVVYCRSFR